MKLFYIINENIITYHVPEERIKRIEQDQLDLDAWHCIMFMRMLHMAAEKGWNTSGTLNKMSLRHQLTQAGITYVIYRT